MGDRMDCNDSRFSHRMFQMGFDIGVFKHFLGGTRMHMISCSSWDATSSSWTQKKGCYIIHLLYFLGGRVIF
jgi:hypothetical protein